MLGCETGQAYATNCITLIHRLPTIIVWAQRLNTSRYCHLVHSNGWYPIFVTFFVLKNSFTVHSMNSLDFYLLFFLEKNIIESAFPPEMVETKNGNIRKCSSRPFQWMVMSVFFWQFLCPVFGDRSTNSQERMATINQGTNWRNQQRTTKDRE
jgi:hypothetical protein